MEPCKAKRAAKARQVRRPEQKPKFQVIKLEKRITPGAFLNHNETLVREPVKVQPKAELPKAGRKPRFRITKLEERIAPRLATNHNETLVRDRS